MDQHEKQDSKISDPFVFNFHRSLQNATCKEDLAMAFQMRWRDVVKKADEKGLLQDREILISLLALQSSTVF